jgi:hypothetical protein
MALKKDGTVLQGTFEIDDVERIADTVDKLRALGIDDRHMEVISSMPINPVLMGRPPVRTALPWLALGGGVAGFSAGMFFTAGTPLLYTVAVGGQAVVPVPPSLVILFESTMAGIMWVTFLGMLFLSVLPAYGRMHYDAALSDGGVGLFIQVAPELEADVRATLERGGAHGIQVAERRKL